MSSKSEKTKLASSSISRALPQTFKVSDVDIGQRFLRAGKADAPAYHFAPRSPASSAVVAMNKIERFGGRIDFWKCVRERDHRSTTEALSIAAV